MSTRPNAVVFDVIETLMSLDPLRARFVEVGLSGNLLELWFDRALCEGMSLTLTGDYAPFPEVAAAALRTLSRGELDEDAVEHVLAGLTELPAHPDAEPAMRALSESGIRMVCLSNGTTEATRSFLVRSGLDGYVDEVMTVADTSGWKPVTRVYEHVLRHLDRSASDVALVAVHAFDCHGAKRAGLTTGWASRLEGHYSDVCAPPDVTGEDLVDVVEALRGMPAAEA